MFQLRSSMPVTIPASAVVIVILLAAVIVVFLRRKWQVWCFFQLHLSLLLLRPIGHNTSYVIVGLLVIKLQRSYSCILYIQYFCIGRYRYRDNYNCYVYLFFLARNNLKTLFRAPLSDQRKGRPYRRLIIRLNGDGPLVTITDHFHRRSVWSRMSRQVCCSPSHCSTLPLIDFLGERVVLKQQSCTQPFPLHFESSHLTEFSSIFFPQKGVDSIKGNDVILGPPSFSVRL